MYKFAQMQEFWTVSVAMWLLPLNWSNWVYVQAVSVHVTINSCNLVSNLNSQLSHISSSFVVVVFFNVRRLFIGHLNVFAGGTHNFSNVTEMCDVFFFIHVAYLFVIYSCLFLFNFFQVLISWANIVHSLYSTHTDERLSP